MPYGLLRYRLLQGVDHVILIDQAFESPAHCSEAVQHLIPDLKIVQVDNGECPVRVRVVACGHHVFMRWQVLGNCMFFGPRMDDGLPLGFITQGKTEGAWTQGDQMVPGCLGGTRFNRQEMYFGMEAGTTLDCAIISEKGFIQTAKVVCGTKLLDKLDKVNIALPDAKHLRQLEKAVLYRLLYPTPDLDGRLEQQLVLIVLQLLDNAFVGDGLIKTPPNRWEVQKAMIDFADRLPPGQAPTVKDLSAAVRWSEDTLIRACKEKFGIKPLDLMKFICLEQARKLVLHPELRVKSGLTTIKSIHQHFGWQKGDKFAMTYVKHFGKKPSEEFVKQT